MSAGAMLKKAWAFINLSCVRLGALIVLLMMLIINVEVMKRLVFGSVFPWSFDIQTYMLVLPDLPHGRLLQGTGKHIRMELVLDRQRPERRTILEAGSKCAFAHLRGGLAVVDVGFGLGGAPARDHFSDTTRAPMFAVLVICRSAWP